MSSVPGDCLYRCRQSLWTVYLDVVSPGDSLFRCRQSGLKANYSFGDNRYEASWPNRKRFAPALPRHLGSSEPVVSTAVGD
ncbi:hypothetical protein AVEN_46935-1 [Araneus ventricosus]|uniref:Uncharacterized protein n=1 Tax=Araneus ventricosus TaxID=182803 RepID=A0A4Y2FKJ7_ARAVE|nr:hypothetical protein AVEN_46935-1 [Araneus ventricosus]